MYLSRNGFTLAEVLITLLIIGIISSIVIPNIIQDSKNAEYKTMFKKSFGDLTQALKKASLDGTIKGRCNSNHRCFRNIFLPYLNYTKTCEPGSNDDCFINSVLVSDWENGASIILNNGIAVLFYSYAADCTRNQSYLPGGACGEALIDVNGSNKGPNQFNKDIYWVEFTETNLRCTTQAQAKILAN